MHHTGMSNGSVERYDTLIVAVVAVAAAFILMEIAYRVLLFAIRRIVKRRRYNFLSQLLKNNRLRYVAHIVAPVVLELSMPALFKSDSIAAHYAGIIVSLYYIIGMTMAANALLSALGDSAFNNSRYHDRPVKGFIQIGKIVVYLIAVIVIISLLTNKSPLYLIGGLGAFAAVLMLIAKDSIMGFVGAGNGD